MRIPVMQRWRSLLQEIDPDAPPRDMRLYVKPKRSSIDDVVTGLRINPTAFQKFLLVGARGGGKSTELRAIRDLLAKEGFLLAEVDLDRSGIRAGSVSAYDLLYISALALLKLVPEAQGEERETLFRALAHAYAGSDPTKASTLGGLSTALEGIAGFATLAATAAQAADMLPGGVPVASSVMALGAKGLTLLDTKQEVVAETSPRGRSLQQAASNIARAVRRHHEKRHLCVLIDGLEKMNGEAAERFEQIFIQTRLLANAEWAAVIAAPPCTFTDTSSVESQGFQACPVYGFGPDDLSHLKDILYRRFQQAGLDAERDAEAGSIEKIVENSGGLPRHAMTMLVRAVLRAASEETPKLLQEQVDRAIRSFAEGLARGLGQDGVDALISVLRTGELPSGRGASLFSDGRILVYPPRGNSIFPVFAVHPLLASDERLTGRGGTP